MKVLMAGQGVGEKSQLGYQEAFVRATGGITADAFRYVPYASFVQMHGWRAFYDEVERLNSEFKPDVVLFQFFHGSMFKGHSEELPHSCVKRLKSSGNAPLVFGSMGDLPYTEWYNFLAPGIAKATYDLARVADAFFVTSMGTLSRALVKSGAKNVIFLPHAYSNTHYPDWNKPRADEFEFDVSMVGTIPRIFSTRPYPSVLKRVIRRKTFGTLLNKRFGERFGLFGSRWNNSSFRGKIEYSELIHLFQRSRVAVDSPAPFDQMYYASDRPFFIAGSGTPLVFYYMPRFEKIFRPDFHAYYVHRLRDVVSVCEHILSLPAEVLAERRKATIELVQSRHTLDNRIDTILSTAEAIRLHRMGELSADEALKRLRLWHFLPEVNLDEERKFAIANWRG